MKNVVLKHEVEQTLTEAKQSLSKLIEIVQDERDCCVLAHNKIVTVQRKISKAKRLLLICFLEENLTKYLNGNNSNDLSELMKGFRLL